MLLALKSVSGFIKFIWLEWNTVRVRLLVVLATCFSFVNTGITQQPIVKSVTSKEGLPSNIVYRITQDTLGQLWLATDNGICVYDGRDVENKQIENLNDHFFPYIQRGPHGGIWMLNISGQLAVTSSNGIQLIESLNLKSTEVVNQFFIDEGFIWIHVTDINLNSRVLCYKIGPRQKLAFVKVIGEDAFLVNCSLVGDRDKVYLVFKEINKEGYFIELLRPIPERSERIPVQYPYLDAVFLSDQAFVGLYLDGTSLEYYHGESSVRLEVGKSITDLLQIDDKLLVCTVEGYHELSLEQGKLLLGPSVLPKYSINTLYKCREGLMWASTYNNGLVGVSHVGNLTFPLVNESKGRSAVSAIENYDGDIVAGTNHGTLFKVVNDQLSSLSNTNLKVNHLLSFDDKLYFSTAKYLMEYSSDGKHRKVATGTIKSFDTIDENTFLISTNIGSFTTEVKSHKQNQKISSEFLLRSYACKASDGRYLWIGNTAGLYRYDLKTGKTQDLGLPFSISDLVIDENKSMYVSAFANGLYKVSSDLQSTKIELPTERILDLHYDNDKLAMATDQGVIVYTSQDSSFQNLNKYNYLPSNNVEAVYLDQNYLWVGSDVGLSKVDLSVASSKVDFLTTLDKVTVNGEELPAASIYTFEDKPKNVNISYQGTAFLSNGELEFEYRLLGLDTSWLRTRQKDISYPNLKSGSYTYQLRSVSGSQKGQVQSLVLEIKKAWYEFRLIQLLLLASFAGLIYWLSRLSHKRKISALRARQLEIKKMEGLQMKALQNHMNPHFVSNALYAIQDLINEKKTWEASEFTANFAEIVRRSMRYATVERISLGQELAFLKVYLDLEKTRVSHESQIELIVDEELESLKTEIFIPALLVQPVIENAFKHANLRNMKAPSLKIHFTHERPFVICVVEDNGVGFGKNKTTRKSKAGKSTGLETVRDRLSLNASQLDYNSEEKFLTIIDNGQEGDGSGTKVIIKIAYKEADE